MSETHFDVAFATDRGLRRTRNEDAVGVRRGTKPDQLLVALADGMGGHFRGDIASQEAIDTILDGFQFQSPFADGLVAAFQIAHTRIRDVAYTYGRRMGTTMVAAVIDGNEVTIANAGDCRAYRVSSGVVAQATLDHSLVAEHLRKGLITDSDAAVSPYRNLVTRSLGLDDESPTVDVFGPYSFSSAEALLLCSDGLYTLVTDEELARTVREKRPEEACEDLIRLANNRGGTDNISVIVVAFR